MFSSFCETQLKKTSHIDSRLIVRQNVQIISFYTDFLLSWKIDFGAVNRVLTGKKWCYYPLWIPSSSSGLFVKDFDQFYFVSFKIK